jgi:hypothetical protein
VLKGMRVTVPASGFTLTGFERRFIAPTRKKKLTGVR